MSTYNETSSAKLGWEPDWFGATGFGSDLREAIKDFQRQYNITPDGMCGPSTYRRKYTERVSELSEDPPPSLRGSNWILCGGEPVLVEWDKVVIWGEDGGLKAPSGTYRDNFGKRDVKMFVNHWDVCLSSRSCFNVLKKRGISVHFLIDNDGTIYQTMDTNHIAWHAGSKSFNNWTVGVEISNAYYPKYQSWYKRNGHGERPLVRNAYVHGRKMEDHLGFYAVQKQAAAALWKSIAYAYDLPLETPLKDNGEQYGTVYPPCTQGGFQGIIHHYNLTTRKIDCGGFDITEYL